MLSVHHLYFIVLLDNIVYRVIVVVRRSSSGPWLAPLMHLVVWSRQDI